MKNFLISIARSFDSLPSPAKAIFYIMLNGILVLLARDVEAISNGNEYLTVVFGGVANFLTYLALYFGAKTRKTNS